MEEICALSQIPVQEIDHLIQKTEVTFKTYNFSLYLFINQFSVYFIGDSFAFSRLDIRFVYCEMFGYKGRV